MIEPVAAGWEALSRASWAEAVALVRVVEDDPEALEVAGVAHWWLDEADATIDARERAYRLYQRRRDRRGAARVARRRRDVKVANDSMTMYGHSTPSRLEGHGAAVPPRQAK